MRLSRAASKFATTPIQTWDSTHAEWADTGLSGCLIAYDRFISDRTFGAEKRLLVLADGQTLDSSHAVLRLPGSVGYMVESVNPDSDAVGAYSNAYVLRECRHRAQLCKLTTMEAASGVSVVAGPDQVLAETWVDVDRYSVDSFDRVPGVKSTIYTVCFPSGVRPSAGNILKLPDLGLVLELDEVYLLVSSFNARGVVREQSDT